MWGTAVETWAPPRPARIQGAAWGPGGFTCFLLGQNGEHLRVGGKWHLTGRDIGFMLVNNKTALQIPAVGVASVGDDVEKPESHPLLVWPLGTGAWRLLHRINVVTTRPSQGTSGYVPKSNERVCLRADRR